MLGPRGAPRGEKLIDVGSPGAPQGYPRGSSGGVWRRFWHHFLLRGAARQKTLKNNEKNLGFCLREGAFSSKFSKCISRRVGRAGVLTNFGKALNSIGFFDTNGLGAFSVRSQKITNAMTKMHPNAGPGRQEKTDENNFNK